MPTIITATQLRSVLGVSSALYDDTYLNGLIDTAMPAQSAGVIYTVLMVISMMPP